MPHPPPGLRRTRHTVLHSALVSPGIPGIPVVGASTLVAARYTSSRSAVPSDSTTVSSPAFHMKVSAAGSPPVRRRYPDLRARSGSPAWPDGRSACSAGPGSPSQLSRGGDRRRSTAAFR